ncbi:MAG TPA: hypothetical protein VIZ28_12290 [Chitinophagaceae bacterium]
MKKILSLTSFLLFCLYACNEDKKEPASENDVDAVRNFIQAALEGNYEKAKTFMLADSISLERMSNIERVNLSPEEKKGLAAASINVHNITRVNDSTTIVIYSNSFKNNWDTLRAVKLKNNWLVDFNYLFDHDNDILMNRKDSLAK